MTGDDLYMNGSINEEGGQEACDECWEWDSTVVFDVEWGWVCGPCKQEADDYQRQQDRKYNLYG